MSKPIECNSCGGGNFYESDQSSLKCDFCGSIINVPVEKIAPIESNNKSRLKAKPEITKPKEKLNSNPPRFNQPHNLVRVDNGWIAHFQNGSSQFVQDKVVSEGGGELIVTRKELHSFEELFDWYSDSELKGVRVLNLSDNNIKRSYDFSHFLNLEELDLSKNKLTDCDFNFKSKKLTLLDLSNNDIESFDLNKTFSFDTEKSVKINLSNNNIKELKRSNALSLFELAFKGSNFRAPEIDLTNNPCDISEEVRYIKENTDPLSIEFLLKIEGGNSPLSRMKNKGGKASDYDNKKLHKRIIIVQPNGEKVTIKFKNPSIDVLKEAYLQKWGKEWKPSSGCFIATAAMGDYNHPKVIELRSFRDNWILKKGWGPWFVSTYYKYGYVVAKYIQNSFLLRKLSYFFIVTPLVYISRIINRS